MPSTSATPATADRSPEARLAGVAHRAAAVIAVPKAAPPDSFVLHAPLELLARVGLVPLVEPSRRDDAIGMIEWLAEEYTAAGDPVDLPGGAVSSTDVAGDAALLALAIERGDVEEVDRLAVAVLPLLAPAEAAGLLGDAIVTSLSAAGHAPIGLALLQRVRPMQTPALLHGALRTIASRPDWQVSWHLPVDGDGDPAGLHRALVAAPHLGRPGSDFIFPLMSQVQDAGLGNRLLAPMLADRYDTRAAANTLTRVAAWSMLHDDPEQAPYGWSHALTMPQAVMSLAGAGVRARTALAVAATFSLGFRVAHGAVPLPDEIEDVPGVDTSWQEVATAAALHRDAHLVKHTLAARHAASDDPSRAGLYLAAAARLVEWWGA